MRTPALLVLAAGAVAGVLAELSAAGSADLRSAVPDLLTGWILLGCGVLAWQRRPASRDGLLLVATALTWFAGTVAADLVSLHRGPLVHLLLTFPTGRARSTGDRVAVAAGYAAAVVPGVWTDELSSIALTAILVLAVAWRARDVIQSAPRARRIALEATAGLGLVLVVGACARLAYPGGDADEPALLAYELALCGVGAALTAALIGRAGERTPLTDLVVELGETHSGSLRDALAEALGDPTLAVGYWAPEAQSYVDADGRTLKLPEVGAGRAVARLERDGGAIAVLIHDAAIDDPRLVEAVAASARMAMSNAGLQTTVQGQVAELRASRRRVLAAGDRERRRLEQRLRDGAQRRLEELGVLLEQARRDAGGDALVRVERAVVLLERTERDLESLGRGLHPRTLTEAGLASALAELVEAGAVPVELNVSGTPLPPEVAATAYFICAEALANVTKHAQATRAAVVVRHEGDRLLIEVSDDGRGGADPRGGGLGGLIDRTRTVGGRLRVEDLAGGGTRLIAELPLDADDRARTPVVTRSAATTGRRRARR